MTGIIPYLYLGDQQDAASFDGAILCVRNAWPDDEPAHAVWIPVVRVRDGDEPLVERVEALPQNLDLAALWISNVRAGRRVLVHCKEGRERSPLVVAWYLAGRMQNLDAAYDMIRKKRPQVEDRRAWLPESF